MERNIYLEHEAEIRNIGTEKKVDWSVATAMWEAENSELVPQDDEMREQMKRAFWKAVDGSHE